VARWQQRNRRIPQHEGRMLPAALQFLLLLLLLLPLLLLLLLAAAACAGATAANA
jgi:hypothetical protein